MWGMPAVMASPGGGISWPAGKDFAFTIFDDTDLATVDNVASVYDFLKDLGFRTTKSVWPNPGDSSLVGGSFPGSTCDDPEYLDWVQRLQREGIEIGSHSSTFHRSTRSQVIDGLDRFAAMFGDYPKVLAQHNDAKGGESIYWGDQRLTGVHAFLYNIATRYRNKGIYRGQIEGDDFFWGDICQARIKYVRNFIFPGMNTLKACPVMPYHDPRRPYVNHWFASSEGQDVGKFNSCVSERNQDLLEREGGACIMYTHFGNLFLKDGQLDSRFKFLMERLSKKNGWFVPVAVMLDHLLEQKGRHDITASERSSLERRWLLHKLRVGTA